MELDEFCGRLDDRLETAAFADLDASANGLQVAAEGPVTHVAFAVDAADETIARAAAAGADALVVHHGLIWGGLDRLTGRPRRRVGALIENDIALYVSHLPLDAHPELGNAAGLAELLGLEDRAPFGALGDRHVGTRGVLPSPRSMADVRDRLADRLDLGDGRIRVIGFGPEEVSSIAVLTGSGADWFDEAAAADVDAYITGEGKGKLYHEAREAGISVVLAGHYATETFGVRSVCELVGDWGLETTFVDAPTGL